MHGGRTSRSEARRTADSSRLMERQSNVGLSVRSIKNSHRGSQLTLRLMPNTSFGSTSNASSPFKDRLGTTLASRGKYAFASGSNFSGADDPQDRILFPECEM